MLAQHAVLRGTSLVTRDLSAPKYLEVPLTCGEGG